LSNFLRWVKFNTVGAMGMGVQLLALAWLHRWMGRHYLYASALAIEVALLHNFVWHVHYTWRDRREETSGIRQLVRFHLSNGLLSMLASVALMWLLVREGRLPVVAANAIAIVCCSAANYYIGNHWAFAARTSPASCLATDRPSSWGR
jgi:putative flippase GtrA